MRILILRQQDELIFGRSVSKKEIEEKDNIGNKLWFMGLVSTISTPENEISFINNDMSYDFINNHFDLCIKPAANLFSIEYAHFFENNTRLISQLKIPVYVIAVGAQAESYERLELLAESIRESALPFIEAVYKSGGEFALRGHFTKALFDYYGYQSAVVTGCPSLYQLGPFVIEKRKLDSYMLMCNGDLELSHALLSCNKGKYFDQSLFFDEFGTEKKQSIRSYLNHYGYYGTDFLLSGRAQLIPDIPYWMKYIHSGGYNFSFGTKIHGSIMALLSGVPALVCPPDVRVREMCEFFSIPTIEKEKARNCDIEDLYNIADYSSFNKELPQKWEKYGEFLRDHHIVKDMNVNNVYFRNDDQLNYVSDMLTPDRGLSRRWCFVRPMVGTMAAAKKRFL